MRTVLIVLGLFVLQQASSPAPPLRWRPQHPQIHAARTFVERDEDTNLIYTVVALDIVDDGAGWSAAGQTPPTCAAAYTLTYRSPHPPAPYEVTWTLTGGTPCGPGSQLAQFVTYFERALGCVDEDLSFYDPAPARNPRSPQPLAALARNLSQLRSAGPFNCPLPPLPPPALPSCRLHFLCRA
jgi:hypothetical protein